MRTKFATEGRSCPDSLNDNGNCHNLLPFFAFPEKGRAKETTPVCPARLRRVPSLAPRAAAGQQTRLLKAGLRHVDPCFGLKSLHPAALQWDQQLSILLLPGYLNTEAGSTLIALRMASSEPAMHRARVPSASMGATWRGI